MKIFVLNCGSSSIKFQFINTKDGQVIAKGLVEKIGEDAGLYTYKSDVYTKEKMEVVIPTHTEGINFIVKDLMDSEHGVISSFDEIDGVGHRVLHGGEKYAKPAIVNEDVKQAIIDLFPVGPLHNPANMMGIEAVEAVMPNLKQVVIFDTDFHQTMPQKAYLYAIPLEYYKKHGLRRYGFHGTSHKYIAIQTAKYLNKNLDDLNMISCHIGNGASVAAIKNGKCVDTSMGFAPLEGLVMGTRCGDIDPSVLFYMMETLGLSLDEVKNIVNKKSGILGLSECSNDMREIEDGIANKDEKCVAAWEVYVYRLKKYIGAYLASLNGADAIVFTGGVGENMSILREESCSDMQNLGIEIDLDKNNQRVKDVLDFTGKNSKVKLLKIPTNEELMIAMETEELLR